LMVSINMPVFGGQGGRKIYLGPHGLGELAGCWPYL